MATTVIPASSSASSSSLNTTSTTETCLKFPGLAENDNDKKPEIFGAFSAKSPLFTHLKPLNSEVKFVQLVLENGSNKPPSTDKVSTSMTSSTSIDESCTICGQHYVDRIAFNAHIKLHLKEKLRRNSKKKLEKSAKREINDKINNDNNNNNNISNNNNKKKNNNNNSNTNNDNSTKRKSGGDPLPCPPEKKKAGLCDSDLMAELAACQPVPPESVANISIPPNPLVFPPTPANSVYSAALSPSSLSSSSSSSSSTTSILNHPTPPPPPLPPPPPPSSTLQPTTVVELTTPDISDMEEDLMTYEMEMNRIDFNNDISSILDQIEKDFESQYPFRIINNIHLDTPPDSDTENNKDLFDNLLLKEEPEEEEEDEQRQQQQHPIQPQLPPQVMVSPKVLEGKIDSDKLDLDKLINDTILNASSPPSDEEKLAVVQSPASIAKVGHLPPKALAVLNQLPSKLFSPHKSGSKLINVIKVERSGNSNNPNSATVINIECQNSQNSKIIETYTAIDTGTEVKLVSMSRGESVVQPPPESLSKPLSEPLSQPPSTSAKTKTSKTCSECLVCGKTITTKNMARHMEKHTGKKKFHCDICQASFFQKTHLKNHVSLHQEIFNCSECPRKFSQKIEHQQHMKTAHGIDGGDEDCKAFYCSVCQRGFAQKGHLNRHLRSHGQSLLSCQVCHKQCKNKISLIRHRTKHLTCSRCGVDTVFNNKIALQEHMIKFHPEAAVVVGVEKVEQETEVDMETELIKSEVTLSSSANNKEQDNSVFTVVDLSPDAVGESLADISNANFFDFAKEINDEFYSSELF